MLRDIIPQNDQKRDKASLLLEVCIPIVFLMFYPRYLIILVECVEHHIEILLYLYAGYRVRSIFTGEGKFIRGVIPRVESRANQTGAMGKILMLDICFCV